MRTRLILAFFAFTGVVLALLWLFQTVWLDDIYLSLKMSDLEKCAAEVTDYASGDFGGDYTALDDYAGKTASKNGVCITVYKIQNRVGVRLINKHINTFCFIHNVESPGLLNSLYKRAAENGGEYLENVSLSEMFNTKNAVDGDGVGGMNYVLVKLVPKPDSMLLLLFNTELLPLESTVKTLRAQLVLISIILLIVAVVLGIVLSQRMSKPLRDMSVEASKLALGDYNVNFDGGDCTESANLSAILNRAAYELSRLDKMQKDLVANVSHDLRTPLTMIAGYTEAMRDLPGEATPENMQIVIDETHRLTTLVNDMLEVSRYQGGRQKLNPTRFNFTDTVRTTIERYGKLKEQDGFNITFESDSDSDVYVTADEGRILQVLYNLVGNAVNYTGEDKTVVIRQSTDMDAGEVLLEVIDSGIGIPEDELPLVWERYYKVNDFHKRANMGTGLGLSIVKNILLLHGAEFGVKSKVGEGSNFWFKLKMSPEENSTEN